MVIALISIICGDIWHKYHEWYFEIVIQMSEIWDNFERSRVMFMPNITYKSCYVLVVDTTTHKRFVIFTCRYFRLSWNTTVWRQLNIRNLSCSSIIVVIVMIIMISINNSMIFSDIWHNYHEWYFQFVIQASEIWDNFERLGLVFFAKYHVQIMLLFIYTTAHEKVCNFDM